MIRIDRISSPEVCVVSWHLVPFFMHETRSWQSLGRAVTKFSDPLAFPPEAMAGSGQNPEIYKDFVCQVEAVALSDFRRLDTGRKCLEFLRSHTHTAPIFSTRIGISPLASPWTRLRKPRRSGHR